MKKLFLLPILVIILFCVAFSDKLIVLGIFSFVLFSFLAYMFVTSDKNSTTNNKLTIIYVLFSFVLTSFSLWKVLNGSYSYHPLITTFILSIVLPSFFLLWYRVIIAIHCFFDSLISKNKNIDDSTDGSLDLSCSIVISTRNEPFDVCKMTFDSAHNIDYPKHLKEIIVVDNSDLSFNDFDKWQDYVNSHADFYNGKCKFIHRDGTEGFKPRNLDLATKYISNDYVLFLDADSTVPKEILHVGLKEFKKNEKLGFLSFLIESTNYGVNLITKVSSIFQNTIRYFNEFVGKNGYCNYQGHNGIWSKKALQAISKWEEYHKSQVMVTEDIAASFRCYAAGFISKPIFLKTGEWVPTSLKEFEKMWLRWSFGGMQIMNKYLYEIISSPKLCFRVKLDMMYLLFKVVISIMPLFALLLVIFPKNNLGFVCIVNLSLLPLIILSIWYYIYGDIKGSILSKVGQIYAAMFMLSSFVFWCCIKAEINYYLNLKQGWKPTSKTFDKPDSWLVVLYNNQGKILFSLIGIISAVLSMFRYYDSPDFWLYFWCMVPSMSLFINTILCVLILGRNKSQI